MSPATLPQPTRRVKPESSQREERSRRNLSVLIRHGYLVGRNVASGRLTIGGHNIPAFLLENASAGEILRAVAEIVKPVYCRGGRHE